MPLMKKVAACRSEGAAGISGSVNGVSSSATVFGENFVRALVNMVCTCTSWLNLRTCGNDFLGVGSMCDTANAAPRPINAEVLIFPRRHHCGTCGSRASCITKHICARFSAGMASRLGGRRKKRVKMMCSMLPLRCC